MANYMAPAFENSGRIRPLISRSRLAKNSWLSCWDFKGQRPFIQRVETVMSALRVGLPTGNNGRDVDLTVE